VGVVGRGVADFQDTFSIDLKKGNNIVMVKNSERGGWAMFFGIDSSDLKYNIRFPGWDALKLPANWRQVGEILRWISKTTPI